jgi:predicted dehydrogenase
MSKSQNSRRKFIKRAGVAGAAIVTATSGMLQANDKTMKHHTISRNKTYSSNDKIRIALIGAGGMGMADLRTVLQNPGTELVAVADLYQTRLENVQAKYGKDIMISRDYREILQRKDIDAVIIATHDHWHQQISIDAMNSGKHVYCEKPMVHSISEGPEVIKIQRTTGKVYQVGSQLLSSIGYEKAKELLNDGAIGTLNYAEGVWTRRTAGGAWNGAIPDDASEKTIDWATFLKDKKRYEFDPERFFNWRKYLDYGTGMNGDLYVHIISGLHFITDSYGPNQVYSSGGIRFWKDGREVPDVLIGTFDYPETKQHAGFNLSLRCNFVDGTNGGYFYVMRLIGSEGAMEIQPNSVKLFRNKVTDGIDPTLNSEKSSAALADRKKILGPEEVIYEAEEGYKGCHYDHFAYWLKSIREGVPNVEDATFGYRAAAPALLCNESYLSKKVVQWDPVKMKYV